MRQLVFDIETSSLDFDTFSESQQEYLLRDAQKLKDETERLEKEEELKKWTSLWPFTARCVVIGMLDVQQEKSVIYYESEEPVEWTHEETGALFKGMSEEELLKSFWRVAREVDQVITFNGRGFDLPFLYLRSAVLRVKPSRNFMGNRYSTSSHIDLLEMLSYYGAFKRFNLDFYCQSFGIESPKSKGVSGYDVKDLYEQGDIKRIAEYCGDDIVATYRLFCLWRDYLQV